MSDNCSACGQPQPVPKNTWLTTAEVVERFKFDPSPYVTTLQSKLVLVTIDDGSAFVRMWLLDSVKDFTP